MNEAEELAVRRDQKIRDMEAMGALDPTCSLCLREFYPFYRETWLPDGSKGSGPFAPAHRAMRSCRSGGRNHCTCDTCF